MSVGPERVPFFEDTEIYRRHMAADSLPYPERIQFELTSECNLRCLMCPITSEPDRGRCGDRLRYSLEDCRKLRLLFEAASVVELTGFGEIFTHPQILDVLRFLKSCKLDVHGSSNGILLTPELSEPLVAEGLMDVLCFSIDAATGRTYRRIRRGATWAALNRNLEALARAKRERGAQRPLIYFSFAAMRRNIRELPDFVRMARRYGACKVIVQHVVENRLCVGESLVNAPELARRFRSEAADVAVELGIELDMRNLDPVETGQAKPVELGRLWTPQAFKQANRLIKDCEFPWKHIFLKSNRDVQICAILWEQMVMGNLDQQAIDSIWNGAEYAQLRDRMSGTDSPEVCVFCLFRGWRKPTPLSALRSEIRMLPEHAGQLGLGWHDAEPDRNGRLFRWMKGPATLFLRNADGAFIELELYGYAHAPLISGRLLVNDQDVGPLDSHDVYGLPVRVPVPPGLGSVLKLEIRLERTWRAGEVAGLSGNRTLGFLAFGAANRVEAASLSRELTMNSGEQPQLGVGWLPAEGQGQAALRWIGGHASLVLPATGSQLRLWTSLPAGLEPRTIRVKCDGVDIGQTSVLPREKPLQLRFALPPGSGWRVINLEVDPAPISQGRPFGVRIHRVALAGPSK